VDELRRLEKTMCLATSFVFVEGNSLLSVCLCLWLQNVHQTMITFKRNMSRDTSNFILSRTACVIVLYAAILHPYLTLVFLV